MTVKWVDGTFHEMKVQLGSCTTCPALYTVGTALEDECISLPFDRLIEKPWQVVYGLQLSVILQLLSVHHILFILGFPRFNQGRNIHSYNNNGIKFVYKAEQNSLYWFVSWRGGWSDAWFCSSFITIMAEFPGRPRQNFHKKTRLVLLPPPVSPRLCEGLLLHPEDPLCELVGC